MQFRRTLLNKCQEEFETGALAMKAVAEREKRAHEKVEEVRLIKLILLMEVLGTKWFPPCFFSAFAGGGRR